MPWSWGAFLTSYVAGGGLKGKGTADRQIHRHTHTHTHTQKHRQTETHWGMIGLDFVTLKPFSDINWAVSFGSKLPSEINHKGWAMVLRWEGNTTVFEVI